MPNSYTAVPNVIPGNLTVAGTLAVQGNVIKIGAGPRFVRLYGFNGAMYLAENMLNDGATRDDNTKPALMLALDDAGATPALLRLTAAGTARREGLTTCIASQLSNTTHTGTVTEDTIFSRVLPATTLQTDRLVLVRVVVRVLGQGAGSSTLRIKLDATTYSTTLIVSTNDVIAEVTIGGRNATTDIKAGELHLIAATVANSAPAFTPGVDADRTLSVTIQNANAADSQIPQEVYVLGLNSYGPV